MDAAPVWQYNWINGCDRWWGLMHEDMLRLWEKLCKSSHCFSSYWGVVSWQQVTRIPRAGNNKLKEVREIVSGILEHIRYNRLLIDKAFFSMKYSDFGNTLNFHEYSG